MPFSSNGIQKIFGCSPKDVENDFSPIAKVIVPEDLSKVIQLIEQSAKNLSPWSCEYRVKLPDQEIRWLWGQSSPEKLEDGGIIWSGFNADITESKKAEEKLRETLSVLERVGEGIDAGLAIIGKDFRVVWANKRLMNLGVLPNKRCYQTFNQLETVCPDCGVKKIFAQDLPIDVHEFKTENAKGETIWIELRVTPLKDKNGTTTAALELAIPITERKKAEQALAENEAKYRLLADNMSDVIWMMDTEGHCTYVSPSVLNLRGYTHEEAIKQSMFEALTPASTQLILENIQHYQETGEINLRSYELEQYCRDGSTVWTEVNITVLRDDKGVPQSILGVSRDITKRKKAEEKTNDLLSRLKKSEDQFRQLFSKMPSGVVVYEAVDGGDNFIIKDFNKTAERIENISCNKVIGKRVTEVFPGVKKLGLFDVLQRVFQTGVCEFLPINIYKDEIILESWRENWVYKLPNGNIVAIYNDVTERKKVEVDLLKSKVLLHEAERAAKIGGFEFDVKTLTQKWTEETFHILEVDLDQGELTVPKGVEFINPEYRAIANTAIQRAVENGEPYDQEWEITTLKGNKRWVHTMGKANWDNGKIKTISGSFQDITQRKMVENRLKENNDKIEMLNEKLRIVGGLTRHDVGNKLAIIRANEFLLRKHIGDKPELIRYLDRIKNAIENSANLFEFSRLYERIDSEILMVIDVFDCFNGAAALFSDLTESNIVNDCQGLTVVADSLLRQLFYNFIDNSIKHGEKVTKIRLHYIEKSDGIKLFYEDNGVGIPEANKPKLFNVDFANKDGGGIGLYLAKKLMDVYGWTITEEGKPGEGAIFVITIPKPNKPLKTN